jgi:DNA-binding transcriptional LysR family regulator
MLNLNHLYLFFRVAEQQHFTRAAEELFISQPAVSKQVRELERSLGLALFESNARRKVQLTPAGQTIYEYAARVFGLVENIEQVVDDIKGLRQGRLAVGASTTIGIYILPPLLGRYKAAYPHIDLFLDIANNEQIQHKVITRQLELGLVEGSVSGSELSALEWQADELVLICAPNHPLQQRAAKEALTIKEVLAYPLILREAGSGTRDVLEKALTGHQLAWNLGMELGSTEAIKQVVAAGLGISFVSYNTIELEETSGRLVRLPISDLQLKRTLWLVYRPDRHFSPAGQAFLKELQFSLPGATFSEYPH